MISSCIDNTYVYNSMKTVSNKLRLFKLFKLRFPDQPTKELEKFGDIFNGGNE